MEELKQRFPVDMDYVVSLDTTLAVTEGIREIYTTLGLAMLLVILVVYVFLQSARATLIPAVAVPVSLIGTFIFFPLLGFSVNTLSLFGLVLAIGLVVDDAIVVVEAVEKKLEAGVPPREAAIQAMEEVSGPVVAIALILIAVFAPTAFIPGITGRLYQQFAVTIALSVAISAFNALTLSPALCALVLKPHAGPPRGPLGRAFGGFNRAFERATNGYVGVCGALVRKSVLALLLLGALAAGAGVLGWKLPTGFLPTEDQGFLYVNVQLPEAASLQRTDAVMKKIETILADTPGVQHYSSITGYSLLDYINATYFGFFFVSLEPWGQRRTRRDEPGRHHGFPQPPPRADGRGARLRLPTSGHLRGRHVGGLQPHAPGPRGPLRRLPRRGTSPASWRPPARGRSWRGSTARSSPPSRRCTPTWTATRCSSRRWTSRRSTGPSTPSWAPSS